jgi:hypothetical protein
MKVNCLHCGHAFGVDDSYCDYEGLLKCPTCGGLLDARIQDGMIRSVRPGSLAAPIPAVQHHQPDPQSAPVTGSSATPDPALIRQAPEAAPAAEPVARTSLSGHGNTSHRDAA